MNEPTDPKALKAEILKLAQQSNGFFKLAVHLRKLKELDPATFRTAYHGKFLQRRRAYDLARIAETFEGSDIPVERLEGIGWTKLTILARYDKHAPSDVILAERSTVHELRTHLAKSGAAASTRVISLRLTPAEYATYRTCMIAHGAEKAKKGKGLVGQEQALMSLISKAKASP